MFGMLALIVAVWGAATLAVTLTHSGHYLFAVAFLFTFVGLQSIADGMREKKAIKQLSEAQHQS
jgi:hypothetical protein